VCVCVVCVWCVCVWCPSLHCRFASRSVREVWSCLCMTHNEAEPLGRNWCIFLAVGLTNRDATDAHEADTLGRNWYAFSTAERNSYVPMQLKTHDRTRERWMGSRRLSIKEQTNPQRILFRHNGRRSSVYRNTHTHTHTHTTHTHTRTMLTWFSAVCSVTRLFSSGEGGWGGESFSTVTWLVLS